MKLIKGKTFLGPLERDASGKDTCALWLNESSSNTIYEECIIDARAGAEAVKATSGARNIHLKNCTVTGGYEDCYDFLNAHFIHVTGGVSTVRGRTLATIKGGASHVLLEGIHVKGTPEHLSFVDIGGHTIYDHVPTEEIHVNKCVFDEWALSITRTWYAKKVFQTGNKSKCLIDNLSIPAFIWRPYFWLRDMHVI